MMKMYYNKQFSPSDNLPIRKFLYLVSKTIDFFLSKLADNLLSVSQAAMSAVDYFKCIRCLYQLLE